MALEKYQLDDALFDQPHLSTTSYCSPDTPEPCLPLVGRANDNQGFHSICVGRLE